MSPSVSSLPRLAGLSTLLLLVPAGSSAQLSDVRSAFFDEDNLIFYEPASGDGFGEIVATGDWNGDGADDLATGIYNDDNLGGLYPNSGVVVIRYGVPGSGLDLDVADTVLSQAASGSPDPPEGDELFGRALASGDFDGDGIDDLAIGAPGEAIGGEPEAGAVQIHYGSPAGIDLAGSQFFHEDSPGVPGDTDEADLFGWALAACDFDGDGWDDLAIGVPDESTDLDQYHGSVNVLFGSSLGLTSDGAQRWHQDFPDMDGSNEDGDWWGSTLACGDFDADGFADLAIGVPGENSGGGGVHVMFGTATGLGVAGNGLWTQNDSGVADAPEGGDYMGRSLAVGDFSGDGFADLAVGVPFESVDLAGGVVVEGAGALHIFFGSATGISGEGSSFWTSTLTTLGASEVGDQFGWALAAGDFDADGFADLAVGTPGEATGALEFGEVIVLRGFSGGVTYTGGQTWNQDSPGVPGENENDDAFGRGLAAGDFDGTGHADLVVGAPLENTEGLSNNGGEWVFYGVLFADDFERGNALRWSEVSP